MWKSIQTNSFYIARKSRDNFMICTMITHSIWCRKCKPCFDNRFIVDLLHASLFTWIPKLCFDIFAFAKIVDVINERLQNLRESICWHGRIYLKSLCRRKMHSFWSSKLENFLSLSLGALNQCNGMATMSAGNVIDYMKNLNCNSSAELRGNLRVSLSSSSPIFRDRIYSPTPTRHATCCFKNFPIREWARKC